MPGAIWGRPEQPRILISSHLLDTPGTRNSYLLERVLSHLFFQLFDQLYWGLDRGRLPIEGLLAFCLLREIAKPLSEFSPRRRRRALTLPLALKRHLPPTTINIQNLLNKDE